MEDTTMNQIRKEINNIKEQRELKKLDIIYKYNHELIELNAVRGERELKKLDIFCKYKHKLIKFNAETTRLIDDIKSKISARTIF